MHDRIDWVLSTGAAHATASSVVGEGGNPNTDIAVDPWPSDHRGIVSTFDVTPASMPLLVAVESRSLEQGDTLKVRFHVTGRTGERAGRHRPRRRGALNGARLEVHRRCH